MDIVDGIKKLMRKEDLSQKEMHTVMDQIMSGEATEAQISGFLIALKIKGETVEEITAAAEVMREKASKVKLQSEIIVDSCGTGGDGLGTFNISTASAFVAAGAGVTVAKHGNRSVSSKSGSADVLEAAKADIGLSSLELKDIIDRLGVGFLFAVNHHKSMKHAIKARRDLKVRTIFNMIGPLTNPAGANVQLMGVFSKEWVRPMAEVLRNLGAKSAMVVHGSDGLDEITVTGKTHVAELKNGEIIEYDIDAANYFEEYSDISEILGGDAVENAGIMMNILSGEDHSAKRNIVLINSGVMIYLAGKAKTIIDGIRIAEETIDSGSAIKKLNEYIRATNI